MGMTRVFFLIKKNNLTNADFHRIGKALAEVFGETFSIYNGPVLKLVPVFAAGLCEGAYWVEDDVLKEMERLSGNPVMAFSVFDSDVAFAYSCENGEVGRYVKPDEGMLEEYGFEEYSTELPEFLCNYGISREELEEIWGEDSDVFAEESFFRIEEQLGTIFVFGEDEEYEGLEGIREE